MQFYARIPGQRPDLDVLLCHFLPLSLLLSCVLLINTAPFFKETNLKPSYDSKSPSYCSIWQADCSKDWAVFAVSVILLPVHSPELPSWLSGKESACQCRRPGFNHWAGKIPWRRKWQPTRVFLPGKSSGQRRLAGCSPWGRKRVRHDLVNSNDCSLFITISVRFLPLVRHGKCSCKIKLLQTPLFFLI